MQGRAKRVQRFHRLAQRFRARSGWPQPDNHLEPVARRLEQFDVPVVLLDKAANNRKPEAGSLADEVPPETIERALALFRLQTRPLIPDP